MIVNTAALAQLQASHARDLAAQLRAENTGAAAQENVQRAAAAIASANGHTIDRDLPTDRIDAANELERRAGAILAAAQGIESKPGRLHELGPWAEPA